MTGIAAVIVALAFAGLPYIASTRIVRDRIAWEMGAWSGYHVTIEGAPRILVWPTFRAVLTEVTLSDWSQADAPPVAGAESVEIDLSAMAALRGDVVFSAVRLIRPTLRVERTEKGLYLPAAPTGGRIARSINAARALVAADPTNPDASKLPSDSFGTVEFRDGRVVTSLDGKDTELVTSLNGKVNWAALNGGAQFSATGIWRGEAVSVEMTSARPLMLLAGGTAPLAGSFKAAPAAFSFNGTASLAQNAYFDGTAKLTAPSLRRMLEWSQAGLAPGAPAGPVSVSSKVSAGIGRIKFDSAEISLNNNPGMGALDFSFTDARPIMSGTLAFETLDLQSLLATFTPLSLPKAQGVREADADLATRFDLDLRLSASHATAGATQLTDVAATAQVKNGLAAFDISDASAFGGTVQASLRLDRRPQGAQAEIRLRASDIDGAAFGAAAGMTRLVPSGKGSVSLILKGPGMTWDSILENADGSISATFGAGTLSGINLPAFVKRSEQGGFFALDEVSDGTVAVDGAELKATISKGVARIDKAEAASPKSKIWLTGIVPYTGRGLALTGGVVQPNQTAAPAEGQSATTPKQVPFFVGGTWSTPFISPIKAGL